MAGQIAATVGGHEIPSWAKCYCVKRHIPSYAHVLPYEMPGGNTLYLCPTSHHSLTVFLKFCKQNGGVPVFDNKLGFPLIVQKLGRLIWAVEQGQLTAEQYILMETYKRLSRDIDG